MSDAHTLQTHKNTAPMNVRKRLCASKKPSCDFQNIPLLCWLLQGYFLPHLVCHQGHCTVLSGSRPKWGLFRDIFRYFHGRMERIFISHFSFSIAEQTQLWTTHRHGCIDTHTRTPHKHTPALPSLTQTSKSSAFQLPAISSIFSQQDPITSAWLLSPTKAAANIAILIAKGMS